MSTEELKYVIELIKEFGLEGVEVATEEFGVEGVMSALEWNGNGRP